MLPDMFSLWSIFFLITTEGFANTFRIRHYPVRVGGRGHSVYDNGVPESRHQRHTMRKDPRQQKRWIVDNINPIFDQDEYLELIDQNDPDDYADFGYADYIYVPPSPVVAFGPVAKNFNVQGLLDDGDKSGIAEITADGVPCSPVWKYKKKIFFGCTASRAGPLWCSTKVDDEYNHMLGHWGWCAPDQVKLKPKLMTGSSCLDGFGVCRLKCELDEIVAVDLTKEKGCNPDGEPLCCIKANGEDPFVDGESSDSFDGNTNSLGDTNTNVSGDASGSTFVPDVSSTNIEVPSEDPGTNPKKPKAIGDSPGATTTHPDADSIVPGTTTTNPEVNETGLSTTDINPNTTTPATNGVTPGSNDTILEVIHVSTIIPEVYSGTAGDNTGTNATKQVILVHNGTTSSFNDLSSKPVTSSPIPEATGATSGTNTNNISTAVPGNSSPVTDAAVATSGTGASNTDTDVTIPGLNDVNPEASIAGTIASTPDTSSDSSGTIVPNSVTSGVTSGADDSNPSAEAITSGGNAANLASAPSQPLSLENPVDAAENIGYESEIMELSAGGSEYHVEGGIPVASNQAAINNELVEAEDLELNNQFADSSSGSIAQPNKREVQVVVSSSKGSILQALLSKVEDIAAEYADDSVISNSEESLDESPKVEDGAIHDDNISSQYVDDIVISDEEVIADDTSNFEESLDELPKEEDEAIYDDNISSQYIDDISQSAASGDIEPELSK